MLTACASTPEPTTDFAELQSIVDYRLDLATDHPDSIEQIYSIDLKSAHQIIGQFSHLPKHRAISKLADWLVDPTGYGLVYDVDANLKPQEVIEQGKGNCLSFTLLLIELAKLLDVELVANQVDLPDVWQMDRARDLVFYRHVNAVRNNFGNKQVFDLAIDRYRFEYPQREITNRQAAAMLLSNIGLEYLLDGQKESARHFLTLAVSSSPDNPDLWINLGAWYKQKGQFKLAEKIYLRAFNLQGSKGLASSNLVRLYDHLGQSEKAKKFRYRAKVAHLSNPYMQFYLAQQEFSNKKYKAARKHINKAISLHGKDPSFYTLRSVLKQKNHRYHSAIKDLSKAYQLTENLNNRTKIRNKLELVANRAKAHQRETQQVQLCGGLINCNF